MDDPGSVTENNITVKLSKDKKSPRKHNPKLSVFREFALATAHLCVTAHTAKQSGLANRQEGARPYFACDLLSRTGIAGLQWKKHLGGAVHVTVSEQKETQTLQDNTQHNGFTLVPFPLDPSHPPGNLLPEQDHSEVHLARCDPMVLLLLEAFDFIYIDPHKTPVPYFSTVFRNVRNGGVVSFVIADTMQFARSPHVVRRWYGAHCMKTEYLKELAVRIILATLAEEAAKCNKAFTVMYALCLEDFLFLTVRVERGLKLADSMLQQNIGHVLHCRICEERAFYPDSMAPVETPYSLLPCDCGRNIPGKTAVIIGPVWKGRIYDYSCLGKLAESGRVLGLSPAFFSLLQGAMQDCLCDTPPSLYDLCGPPTNVDPAQQNHGDQSCVDQLQSNGRSSETSCVHDSERQGIDNTSEDHSSRPCQEDRTVKDTHEDTKNNDLNFDGKKKDTSTCKTKEDVEQISKDRDCAEADNLEKNYVRSNSSCKLDNDSSHTENDKRSVSAKNTDNSLPEENNHILSSDTNDHSSSLQRSNTSMISKIKQPDTEPLFDGRTHLKEDIVKNHTVKQTESEENVTNNLTVQETKAEEGGDDKKRGVKRPTSGLVTEAECHQQKRVKVASEPAPCFYYNMHSKRMCTGRLPRYQLVVERLRALGYRSCRTHFEKYAIRTDATMKVLTDLVGSTDNKVLYVKGSRPR